MVPILRSPLSSIFVDISQTGVVIWPIGSSAKENSHETNVGQHNGPDVWSQTEYCQIFYSHQYHSVGFSQYRLGINANEAHAQSS